ncbi:MAG: ParB N-terminal domain-containing protein [Phycisphaerales bacterium]|nr:ParB N-terminal domain-containing protein [Phycisphaerales bacterium]
MNIVQRAIDEIIPYNQNPRQNDAAVETVAASIREFGFRVPIVVDTHGVIICGHTRWKAARHLGLETVPVHVATDLTPEQVRAYRIADNKAGELAEWDLGLLHLELSDLRDAEFDLSLLGFDADDLKAMLASPGSEGLTPADDAPAPPDEADAISQPGDLWILNGHRLLCGDSTSAADVERLMDGERAALVATDPPYLVDYTGERPNDSGKDWSRDYREIDIPDAEQFFRDVFTQVAAVVAPHAAIYCWHAHKRCGVIQQVWRDLGILDHQSIVWVKPTPVFGRVFWHFRHEPCMMGWVQGSKPEHDADHTHDSVWEIDWEGKARIVGNEHPTQKPVEIFARPMRKHTRAGDVCYEPFSGSGSQIIAGEREGRRVFAMEISPVFVDVAVRRWEAFTGERARRFDDSGDQQPGLEQDAPSEASV